LDLPATKYEMVFYEEVDIYLLQCFIQKKAEGTLIFGSICAQKAKVALEASKLQDHFNTSVGWLPRMKQQYVLHCRQYVPQRISEICTGIKHETGSNV
jgi:hypothetical protein